MIRRNRASLAVYSDGHTVAEISAMLGIDPMSSGDVGELTSAGRNGVKVAPERRRHQRTLWSITETDDDTLRKLVDRLAPHVHALAELRRPGETIIWWSGEEVLLTLARELRALPGVPEQTYAVVSTTDAAEWGVGRRVDLAD